MIENGPPLRILSLDGGGVRGISSHYILKRLVEQMRRGQHLNDKLNGNDTSINLEDGPRQHVRPPRPCDVFDLICGTGTGGLVALMLGRLEMVILMPC